MSKLTSLFILLMVLSVAAPAAVAQRSADDHYREGALKFKAGDLDGALSSLDKAIESKADVAIFYAFRSELRVMTGQLDPALADLDKALFIDPNLSKAYARRGRLRMLKGDSKGALSDLDNAIVHGEKSAEAFADRGELKMLLRDPAGAQLDFNNAIAAEPTRIRYYLARANARQQLGDEEGALADYTAVINAYEEKEREGTAPDKEARRIRANDTYSPMIQGTATSKPGDPKVKTRIDMMPIRNQKASAMMTPEQMEYLPNVGAAYSARSNAHEKKGNSQEALNDINKAIELYPLFYFFEVRGRLSQKRGDLSAALADFNQSIEIQPGMALSHIDRGAILTQMGKDEEAEKDFSQSLKLDPNLDVMVGKRRAAAKKLREEKP